MKIRQNHIETFKKKVQHLDDTLPTLVKTCDDWLAVQRERETYGSTDQERAKQVRERLEMRLDKFREEIGALYDFMAEKGLRDIEAVTNNGA